MTINDAGAVPATQGRRTLTVGLLRALAAAAVLVALYYLLPLDHLVAGRVDLSLIVGLIVLIMVTLYQLRAIDRAAYPGVRAVMALATVTPLFLLIFAATYYLMAKSGPENFNVHALTRTDALYFTITVFSTVGFGDISATSQVTRVLVSIQMILDLLILGYGIRLFMGVAERAKSRQPTADRAAAGAAGDSAVGDRPSQ